MKRYFINHPVFRIIAPVIYGILIYLLILLINNSIAQVNEIFSSQEVYIFIALTAFTFESCRLIIILFRRYEQNNPTRFYLPLQIISSTGISVGLVMLCLTLYFAYAVGFSMSDTQTILFTAIFSVTALLYNILYLSHYYLQKENTLKLQSEMQQREILEMEMNEFQQDINPDLLYESLENLIGIMYRDIDKAEEYIDSLASAYRYVLTNRHQEIVPLSAEIDAAKNLIRILNEKYFGQLKFDYTLDGATDDARLIPGSLPIVLESIIRNSIITRFEPFSINCYLEDDYMVIQSRLNDRLISYSGSKTAFARLQKSYSLYSDLPLIQVKAYQDSYIKIPVLKVEEAVATNK
ncbi:MAG TPA: histidine kinase [Ohtaekwangia sp.]|uniref:histidine kinase n=1 Tax=Ohtaekwangia sp. TaxID=2066019 RepID=UPI002F9559C1